MKISRNEKDRVDKKCDLAVDDPMEEICAELNADLSFIIAFLAEGSRAYRRSCRKLTSQR